MAMTWKVLQKNYVLDGYSICDSSAGNLFSMFDYRKQVITYFVKCIVYYAVKCIKEGNKFEEIIKSLKQMGWLVEFKVFEKGQPFFSDKETYIDQSPAFHVYTDIDYDLHHEFAFDPKLFDNQSKGFKILQSDTVEV